MWSFFSKDPVKEFAYEIGEKVDGLEEKSFWSQHSGKHKTTGEPVSIFAFDVKNCGELQLQLAKGACKRLRTLRHPNIVTYVDSLESDKVIYLVTEFVTPLNVYLTQIDNQSASEVSKCWGLHQIAKVLSFLNNDGNLSHNNVCLSSVFVDKAGEWKLGAVDFMHLNNAPDMPVPAKSLPYLERYSPPEKSTSGAPVKAAEKWSTDAWGLGCLIWEVYHGLLPKTTSLKSAEKIPKSLLPHYKDLLQANPKQRMNPAKFLESCKERGGFMDNKFVETMLFIEEIHIKDGNEKMIFFNTLSSILDSFPEQMCKYKILPQLINAFEFGNTGSAILKPLFQLGKLLDASDYQKKIVPCIVKLFDSPDRATRVKLLQELEHFVEYLSPDVINGQIFLSITQGFMDTNAVVREQTIKSMLHIAPKLNYKNLNEEVLKHFARLQSRDEQGGIRANTTVCLGKISGYLQPQMRQKVLLSAYLRAVKDPFPPARQAGILAMAATHNYFTLSDIAFRLLPALALLTLDADKTVRDQTFKAMKAFIGKLEKVSENPELLSEIEKDVNSGTPSQASSSGWTGWAVSGMGSISSITSKLYRNQNKGGAEGVAKPQTSNSSVSSKEDSSHSVKSATNIATSENTNISDKTAKMSIVKSDSESEDEWKDANFGDMERTQDNKEMVVKDSGDWDTEDWGSIEETSWTKEPSYSYNRNDTVSSSDHHSDKNFSSPASVNDWGTSWDESDKMDQQLAKKSVAVKSSVNQPSKKSPTDSDWSSFLDSDGSAVKTSVNKNVTTPSASITSVTSSTKSAVVSKTDKNLSSVPAASSGWDDASFDNNGDWSTDKWESLDEVKSEAEMLRDAKKVQRQQELEKKRAARQQGSGAMKLGTKKL